MRGAVVSLKLGCMLILVALLSAPVYIALSRVDEVLSSLALTVVAATASLGQVFVVTNLRGGTGNPPYLPRWLASIANLLLVGLLAGSIYLGLAEGLGLLSASLLVLVAVLSGAGLVYILLNISYVERRAATYFSRYLLALVKAVAAGLVVYVALRVLAYFGVLGYGSWVVLVAYAVFYVFYLASLSWLVKTYDRISRIRESPLDSLAGRGIVLLAMIVGLLGFPIILGYYTLSYAILAVACAIAFFLLMVMAFRL